MSEPLTIKDLNCSTCNTNCNVMPKSKRKEDANFLSPRYHARHLAVEMMGCASHPLALQVMAAPVIAELEQLKGNVYQDFGGRNAYYAYEITTKLLKGERS